MSYNAQRRAAQPARAIRRTDYRTDPDRHRDARAKVPPARRSEIASLGGQARAASYGHPADRRRAREVLAKIAASVRPAAAAPLTPAQKAAARAARAAATRPARRAAAKLRKAREAAAKLRTKRP